MNRILAPLFIPVPLSFLLIACGGGSSTPPPPPPAISITFSTAPPTSMGLSANAPIAVTVSNDSGNAGVTFSCTPSGSCGTFTGVTSTGATYNAPSSVPSGGSVTIIATSVTDTTKSARTIVSITGPTITVSFTSAFPSSLPISSTLPVTVSLTNDSNSQGVTWSCAPAGCGTFTNTAATSATYNAPSSVPSGGSVTIIATSVAQTSASQTSPSITITSAASNASLNGHYAFFVTSPTGDRGTAVWAGSVELDGKGNVLGGMEDVVSHSRYDLVDQILATGAMNPNTNQPSVSSYSVDGSGHGRLVMSTFQGETLAISFALTSNAHAEIIEADGVGGEAGDPGSGTLDLQDTSAFSLAKLAGTYSLVSIGVNALSPYPPVSFGGVVTIASAGTISGTFDTNDSSTNPQFHSATISFGSMDTHDNQNNPLPDANGRGTFHFGFTNGDQTRSLTYYIVSSKVIRFVESGGISWAGGSMYSQGSATTSLSGSYVYQHSGWGTAGRSVAAGTFTVSSGTISPGGTSDANKGGPPPFVPAQDVAITAASLPASAEAGVIGIDFTDGAGTNTFNAYPVDPALNILDPNNTSGGGGALLLHTDSNLNGIGLLIPQKSPAIFSSNYALNLINSIAGTVPDEVALIGLLTGDGVSAFAAGATNLADYTQTTNLNPPNLPNPPNPMIGASLSGTFTADTLHSGRYTGTFTVGVPPSALAPYPFIPGATAPVTFSVGIYQATAAQAFVVETDTQAINTGQIVQQVLP